jgi:radical SAM-linked protein
MCMQKGRGFCAAEDGIITHMNQALTQQRVRITFGKQGSLRFIGHLDLSKTWERVLRRAQVPLEYTQGFNPRPRMQFASALPLGVTSECEYLDVWLTKRLDGSFPDDWIARLNAVSPSGLVIYRLTEVPIKDPSLPIQVTGAGYVITLTESGIDPGELQQRVDVLLAAPTLLRIRNQKTVDLRPLILNLSVDANGHLLARLVTGEKGNARPDELLQALGLDPTRASIHRCCLSLSD